MTIDEIVAALEALVDKAKADGRELDEDEMSRYEDLEKQLNTAQRSAEIQKRHAAYLVPGAGLQVLVKDDGEDTLERAFDHYLRTGIAREEMVELRAQSKGTDAAGGYTVPDGFLNRIVQRLKEFGGFANEAETLVTASGNPLEFPSNDDTANTAEIVAENAAAASAGADLVFGTVTLGAYKYEATGTGNLPLKVSWELLQDSAIDIQPFIARKLGERIGRKLAVDFVTGSGVAMPQGIVTPKTPYDEITSNTVGPTYAELLATLHALDPAYRANAKWLMNDATLAVLRGMLDGNDRPLWQPAHEAGINGLPGGTLLGHQVVVDQAMPSIGDQTKFLAFGDFREAYVARRIKQITLVVLNELYAVNGQVGFMAWGRFDGKVKDPNAYVILAGENAA